MDYFDRVAKGVVDAPKIPKNDFIKPETFLEKAYCKHTGPFNHHYLCSIPGILKHELNLAKTLKCIDIENILTISTSEGALIKTVCENNNVYGLCTTENTPNVDVHYQRPLINVECRHNRYWDIDCGKFDVVYVDTAFMMAGNNRKEQIQCVKKYMKPESVLIVTEKLNAENYYSNELIKKTWKQQWFENVEKKEQYNQDIQCNLIRPNELHGALSSEICHVSCLFVWGNFASYCASNNRKNFNEITSIYKNG